MEQSFLFVVWYHAELKTDFLLVLELLNEHLLTISLIFGSGQKKITIFFIRCDIMKNLTRLNFILLCNHTICLNKLLMTK